MKTLFQYILMMVIFIVIFSVTPFILPLEKAQSQQENQNTDHSGLVYSDTTYTNDF